MFAPIRPTPTKPILEDFIRTKLSHSQQIREKDVYPNGQNKKEPDHRLSAGSRSGWRRGNGLAGRPLRFGAILYAHAVMVHHRSPMFGRLERAVTGPAAMIVVIRARTRRNLRSTVKCERNQRTDGSDHRDRAHLLAPLCVHAGSRVWLPAFSE